jgi:hypothetical protein
MRLVSLSIVAQSFFACNTCTTCTTFKTPQKKRAKEKTETLLVGVREG